MLGVFWADPRIEVSCTTPGAASFPDLFAWGNKWFLLFDCFFCFGFSFCFSFHVVGTFFLIVTGLQPRVGADMMDTICVPETSQPTGLDLEKPYFFCGLEGKPKGI